MLLINSLVPKHGERISELEEMSINLQNRNKNFGNTRWRKKGEIFEAIITENSPKLMTDTKSQIQTKLNLPKIDTEVYCCCCSVAKSCPTLWDPMDCSPPGSSVHGISKARITFKLKKIKTKKTSWKNQKEKRHLAYRGLLYIRLLFRIHENYMKTLIYFKC